jgi:hypothetical protein
MADFETKSTTKSAVRKLADPLADVTAFDNLVQGVIANNPFQCTTYNQGGSDHPPVERTRQGYTSRIIYQDGTAKTIALITVRAPTIAAFHGSGKPDCGKHPAGYSARRDTGPGSGKREVRSNPSVPRCQWRDLLRELQPGAGDPHLILRRCDPEQGRDLGGHRGGAGLVDSVSREEYTGRVNLPVPIFLNLIFRNLASPLAPSLHPMGAGAQCDSSALPVREPERLVNW